MPRTPRIVKYPLRFFISYVQSITQQYESGIIQKVPLSVIKLAAMKNTECQLFKSEVSITFLWSAMFNPLYSSMNQKAPLQSK